MKAFLNKNSLKFFLSLPLGIGVFLGFFLEYGLQYLTTQGFTLYEILEKGENF
jgi:hypothetical protein